MCNSGQSSSGRSDIYHCRRNRASPPCSRQGTCHSTDTSHWVQSSCCTFCRNVCSSPRSPGKRACAYNSPVNAFYRSIRRSRRRCHIKPPRSRRVPRRNELAIHYSQCRYRGRIRQSRHCSNSNPGSIRIRGRIRFLQSIRRSRCSGDPQRPSQHFPRICRGHSPGLGFR